MATEITGKPETKRERFDKRMAGLKADRDNQLPEWRDLAENFVPRTMPWLLDEGKQHARQRRNTKIINTTPVYAARVRKRGMAAGVASPARPWFRLRTFDRDLNEFAPVKLWLHRVQQALEDLYARSNFYNVMGVCLGEEGIFGTLAMGMFEDPQDDLRCDSYPIGSYLIATNAKGRVDTFYRTYRPTVRQIVAEFVFKDLRGAPLAQPDFARVSGTVRQAWQNGQTEQRFEVVHVIEPNDERDPRYADNRNLAIRSCYYELGQSDKGILLRESGFNETPVLVGRLDVLGEDPWGTGPGLDALGDAKELQVRAKQKATRIDKHNAPALVGHPELKNKRVSLLSGDITYVGFTPNGGKPGLQTIHDVDPDIRSLIEDTRSLEDRVSHAFDVDLFLLLAMADRSHQVTAEQIAREYEEKVVMLGPELERKNHEVLNPAIDRAFAIALRRGLLPPPPEELEDQPLKVEYVSVLAQAQRLVTASSIDRFAGFVGGLAKSQHEAGEAPEVLDKFDFDQAADEYAESLGVPPTVIRSDEQVESLRDERRQRAQAQALAAAAQPVGQVAKATKDLSETQVAGRSALERMVAPE